jgi:hypothetical protein
VNDDKDPERRRFQRVLFDAPAQLITPREVLDSGVVDLSLKGVLVRRPAGWRPLPEEGVLVDIALDRPEARIRMHAAVAHIEPDHVGLHCRHIDVESAAHLRRVLELNLGDPSLLERELSTLG